MIADGACFHSFDMRSAEEEISSDGEVVEPVCTQKRTCKGQCARDPGQWARAARGTGEEKRARAKGQGAMAKLNG